MRSLPCLFATVLIASPTVSAQVGGVCPLIVIDGEVQPTAGPGEAFGVIAYQCASCAFKRDKGAAPEYSFNAEPRILATAEWSALRQGDVIEAINGQPITTRAGSDLFTYPSRGESLIAVRRDGTRVDVKATPRADCNDPLVGRSNIARVEVWKGPLALQWYGAASAGGVIQVYTNRPPVPLQTVRPEPVQSQQGASSNESATTGRYGFAISCFPSCTRARAADGTEYWRFDGQPPIAGIRAGGAAAMAGLQVGDVVLEIDGISILTEQGALRFQQAERRETLNVTVQRLGKRVAFTLKPR